MAVRTLLSKTSLPYSIRRELTESEKDVGEVAEIATFASFSLACEVWMRVISEGPTRRLTLQNGARVVREHDPKRSG